METVEVRDRLLTLARERDVSLSALSRMIGKNPSYLQQFIRKGSPRKLEETDRLLLARFFEVPEEELGKPKENSAADLDQSGGVDWLDIPRLSLGASAGPGALSGDEAAFDAIRFSARWLRSLGLRSGHLSVLAVVGDSMEPTLRDGDEILVDRTPAPLRDGVHLLRVDDTVLVKRVETGHPGRILLLSDNQAYSTITCLPQDVTIIGRVVWKGGRI